MSTYSLTLRGGLGRKLTIQEMDENFLYVLENATGGGGSSTVDFIAGENIPIGVGVSILETGEVVRTLNQYDAFTFSGNSRFEWIQVSENKTLIVYQDYDNSSQLKARVIENSGENITSGSDYVMTTEFSDSPQICKIGTDKFLIAYNKQFSGYFASYTIGLRVAEISGSVVTLGDETVINPNTGLASSPVISLDSYADDSAVIAYRGSIPVFFTNFGTFRKISISGTSISLDTQQIFVSEFIATLKVLKIDSNRVLILYYKSSNNVFCKVYNIFTDTLGSEFEIGSSGSSAFVFDSVLIDTNKVLVNLYNTTGNTLMHYLLTISGESVSLNNSYEFENTVGDIDGSKYSKSVLIDTNKIAIILNTGSFYSIYVINFSSGYEVYTGVKLPSFYRFNLCLFDTNKINIRFLDTNPNPDLNNIIPGEIIDNKFFNSSLNITLDSYIGFSQNSANVGETVTVKISGGTNIDENQSGLVFGKYYSIDGDGNLTDSPVGDFVNVGRAISENALILRNYNNF
jgi:hypothetical protein